MKVYLFLLFLCLFCQDSWYRKLPPNGEDTKPFVYKGVWLKKTNPRSAINSSWHKNNWSEKIQFFKENTFRKTYESNDYIGSTLVYRKVEGVGTYTASRNWILLETKNLSLIEKHNGYLIKNEFKKLDSSLLYYYFKEGNLIIPMIYDMGYKEKEFGVKDGVSIPYDDENSNFFRYIKIYAFKEFQSHAYYPEN